MTPLSKNCLINKFFNNLSSGKPVLNVDRTLWAFAVNQVIQNLDCYNTSLEVTIKLLLFSNNILYR